MALMDLLRAGGEYYLGQENIRGAQQLGRETQAGAQALAQEARAGTEFRPYTVTSGLANVGTTAEGGFDINLSPEQQALQPQLQGQVGGLFGQVGADPATAQAQLYEQMRAIFLVNSLVKVSSKPTTVLMPRYLGSVCGPTIAGAKSKPQHNK